MGTKKLRVCMFVDEAGGTPSEGNVTAHQGYLNMRGWLTMYLSDADVMTGIRPFQLHYRDFDVYLVDVGGYPLPTQSVFMTALGNVVRGRSSRLYLFWTGESWETFRDVNTDLWDLDTCINCCETDALEKIERILLDMSE